MKTVLVYIKYSIPGVVIGGMIVGGIQLALAWTTPTFTPQTGNAPAPINVSGNQQTKTGALVLSTSVYSPIFVDLNNGTYYVDPSGTSNFATLRTQANNDTLWNNWGLLTYGYGGVVNSDPANSRGSIYTNDVYFRSIGKWASEFATKEYVNSQIETLRQTIQSGSSGGAPCNNTIAGNLIHMQIGYATHASFQSCAPDTYQCINGSLTLIAWGACAEPAGTCFPKDTPVLMASGEYKAIDEIKTGEKVMGMNGSTNTVRGLWRPKLGDRTLYSVNGDFKTTGDHMILAKNETGLSWGSIEPTLYNERRYMKPAVVHDSTGGKMLISNSNIAPEALMKLSEGSSLVNYRGNTVTLTSLEKVSGTSPDDQLYTLYTDNTESFVVNGGYVVDGMPQHSLSEVLGF